MRSSITSTFTGVAVSRIDIEPVAIDDFACASSVALRPSQPTGALPAWPMPISGCDLRDVSLPESFRLRASVTAQPRCGKWQVAQAVLPDAESCGSKNRSRPEIDQRRIFDRQRRRSPVLRFHSGEFGLGLCRRRHA